MSEYKVFTVVAITLGVFFVLAGIVVICGAVASKQFAAISGGITAIGLGAFQVWLGRDMRRQRLDYRERFGRDP